MVILDVTLRLSKENCHNISIHFPKALYLQCFKQYLNMHFSGLIIAVITFLLIGVFHPIVIKSEYHFGTRCWPMFAIAGIAFILASLSVQDNIASTALGVTGCSCLWSILEIFEQKKRVEKGWFPMNPKRKGEYKERP